MILSREFTSIQTNDYETLASAGGRLRAVLDAFAENRLPEEYGPDALWQFGKSLLSIQLSDGSFSSYPKPEELEPELRTEAQRFISWCTLAFFTLLDIHYPESWNGHEKLTAIITRGLNSPPVSNFDFPESGPAELVQIIEAVLILSSGKILELLLSGKLQAPELMKSLKKLLEKLRKRLENGDTCLPGGIEYRGLIMKAMNALSVIDGKC